MGIEALNILILDEDRSAANFTALVLDRVGVPRSVPISSFDKVSGLLANQDFDIIITTLRDTADLLGVISDLERPPHLIFLGGGDEAVQNTIMQLVSAHKLTLLGRLEKPVKKEAVQTLLQSFKGRQEPKTGEPAKNKSLSAEEVRIGLEKGYLFPHFQPKVEIKSGKLVGVECLARWQDPDRGLVFPDQFISVAEEHGLIRELTRSIFVQAMKQAAEWHVDGLDVKVSVNASMDDLEDKSFSDFVLRAAGDAGVAFDRVMIEVTETKIMSDIKGPLATLSKLRNKGVGISIDDYGTGFSSLKQVSQVPATELKVDREFVFEAWKDKEKRVLLETSIDMGRKLKLHVAAEGAETIKDWRLLEELGCDSVQGYFCAKPMAASELIPWYKAWQKNKPEPVKRKPEKTITGSDGSREAEVGFLQKIQPGHWLAMLAVLAAAAYYFVTQNPFSEPQDTLLQSEEITIAVLPFADMSPEGDQVYFTDGISEEILNVLAKIPNLHVTSRSSAFRFRGSDIHIPTVAQQLGVTHVLEGSVRKSGARIRITAQLIDAASDTHLWSETYDRELTTANIFDIQSDIAAAIAAALRSTLSLEGEARLVKAPTENMAALEAYFRGKQLLGRRDRDSLTTAGAHFEEAIDLDPDYASAYSGLADVYMLLPQYDPELDRAMARARVREAVTRALMLDPDLPEALASMAWYRLNQEYDWAAAEALFRRALEIHPSNLNAMHWMSHLLSWQGRHLEALALAERAVVVDPVSPLMRTNLAYIMVDAGQYDVATTLINQLIEEGSGLLSTLRILWQAETRMRRFDSAANSLVRWAIANGLDVAVAEQIGQILQSAEENAQASEALSEQLARWPSNLEISIPAYAAIMDADQTIELLEQAYQERAEAFSLMSLRINPSYDFLRDDPRFKDLLHRVGLDDVAAGGQ